MERTLVKAKRKELGISCMLNTEVGAVLAVIRRPISESYLSPQETDHCDSSVQQSLKSLRALIFNPQQEWRTIDPLVYLSPFLEVIQSDEIPASATAVALSSILKILKIEIFDEKSPGARDAMNSIVSGITSCRLEKTDSISEDAVMMRILQVLTGVMKHPASELLEDQAVCTIVNTCFQVVQQSAGRGDLLQRNGRYTMHELIQIIFSRLPDFEVRGEEGGEDSESDTDEIDMNSGYGIRCCIDIFHFLCSLLNVVEVVENSEGTSVHTADEDVQIFALVLINSAIELSGDAIGQHPKLLRMVQDDLFHHLIHYGASSSPLVLSMISSCILNIYHFLRKFVRLQLEAFFSFVLLKVTAFTGFLQLQEVALEGLINFCRQPEFIVEAYVNYDCDPICRNVFEETGKVLCRHTFPTSGPLTSMQIQAFEGLVILIHNIADNMDREEDEGGDEEDANTIKPSPVEINEYIPFWIEKPKEDFETWVEHIRVRKAQKRKLAIAANHFNRDEKKGLEYLKYNHLVSDPPDPMALASFFRFTPGLDKTMIGDYLGDPDELHLSVLKSFTHTFEFTGMNLDTALRTFLESFRLPGESQKIERMIEAFSERFYDQQSSDIFASKDTVHILCYSLIMLNTDQHNPQVKKKMTEDEFIRNNRAINAGKDLPREYLSELFQSISTTAFALSTHSGPVEMNPNKWIELMNRTKTTQPLSMCQFDRRIGRDMFATIAGPSIAAVSAFFEHSDDDEVLHECVDALISIARVAQYGLEDILDELIASFCKFTTLLNPYTTPEETLFAFSHDMKPRMATLAVFTLANSFGDSIRGGWRNIVDCLLKLRKLQLLPQSAIEFETADEEASSENDLNMLAGQENKYNRRQGSSLMGRFSHFLALDSVEESVALGMSEFEQNLKVIKQCRIGQIFSKSSVLPDVAVLNLGRSLIYAAAGKGQKFSTAIEEEETVKFCWDLIIAVALSNIHRFSMFWPSYHEYLLNVANFPLFSPIPFVEKGIPGLFKVCIKILASNLQDQLPEELIFRSITIMWKIDKEIIDTCYDTITEFVSKIITEHSASLQTQIGWKSVLQLLSLCGRHPETKEQAVDALIGLMSTNASHLSQSSYAYCIDCSFSFVALRNSAVEKNLTILDLMTESVTMLVQWYKTASTETTGNNYSVASNTSSSSSVEENSLRGVNFVHHLFLKLSEAFRKTTLARREEIRNRAVTSLERSFIMAHEDLGFTPSGCIYCIDHVIFPTIDDLHEKLLDYSRRENAEREMRSMEGTLKTAMKMLKNVFLHYLEQIVGSAEFRTFWLGVLRRMDTCMKADLGEYGDNMLQEVVPELLTTMIGTMKEKEILVQKEDDDLWEITYIQIQWIAPSLKDELFPDEDL
ncbi:ARF guanine-nucleotide exchange factor GNL2 [Raphanus sativus]|uniref:ARF guanine-nucleotide exchange factor GNL2 n=1 Tax=Raphanus sativus TaxID=3726 RepID=A0A6J0K9T2_RAPSA|nr:ARF guanine-nucleotide exchange factor GNL2 [Raphanus sativus]KAJ4882452.1 ARF guanine-nucleotide exchange factor GNL2 [Raphanus sativus]